MVKFAFLVMFELRAIKKTIEKINKYIISAYNADIFLVCQKFSQEDEDNLKLFCKDPIVKIIYEKKDPLKYYNISSFGNISQHDWNSYNRLQMYINEKEMLNNIDNYIDNYDYFIRLRIDSEILFPFPDKELFEEVPKGIWTFNARYTCNWGNKMLQYVCKKNPGYSLGVFIHRDYIRQMLNSTYKVITNTKIENQFDEMNQETFNNYCFNNEKLTWSYINNINIYFTAESEKSKTTWSTPLLHPIYNIIYKYIDQFNEAYKNNELWMNGYRWTYKGDIILLEKIGEHNNFILLEEINKPINFINNKREYLLRKNNKYKK